MTERQKDGKEVAMYDLIEIARKGVWIWQKEWWWVIAINEVIARKTPNEINSVVFSIIEVNDMIDELAGSVSKRLLAMAKYPIRVGLKGPEEIIVTE